MTSTTRRGRPPQARSTIRRTLYLDAQVDSTVELLLLDPLTGKPKQGAYGLLVTRLLREWISKQRKEQP